MVMIVGYFLLKVIKYGIIAFLNDQTLGERYALANQCFDLVFLGGSLFIYRTRRWPVFFSIGLNDMNVKLFHLL